MVLLFFSVAMIIIATLLPFGGMPAERIPPAWCLECGALWLTDAIANVALFVPFGAALTWPRRSGWQAIAASLLLSVGIEILQSLGLPPGRSAALADIITNTVGGAIGALAIVLLRSERDRSAESATWLALGWTAIAVSALTLSARAMQPLATNSSTSADRVYPSPFGHVPGFGWFAGVTDSAAVDNAIIRHRSRGPIMLGTARPLTTVRAAVWAHGTDLREGSVPLLFVHQQGDSAAWLQIAKRDNDAELVVMRTAQKWGLTFPSVIVRDVFANRTTADSSTVALLAVITSDAFTLKHGTARTNESRTLRITPLLGWSLIQPVFTVQSPLAGIAQWCWVWFWMLPITWWARRSRRPRALPAALGILVCATLYLLPPLFGLAALTIGEWLLVLTALCCGAIVASLLPPLQSVGDDVSSSSRMHSSVLPSENA